MNKDKSVILVIFGVSGDLSTRYLLPAISQIAGANMLPKNFHIVGITRQSGLELSSILGENNNSYIESRMSIFQMDVNNADDYKKLDEYLNGVEKKFDSDAEQLFYLSVPSQAVLNIARFLGEALSDKVSQVKLLLEKPFGVDLESAKNLIKHIDQYFKAEQIYMIDHYLAKKAARDIVSYRTDEVLFEETLDKDFVEKIEVVVSEKIDVQGRADFYEQTGALKDMIQSHLIELASLILMKLPSNKEQAEISSLRLEALKNLSIESVRYGQYENYKEETRNHKTKVETFVSVVLKSIDSRWTGVPIILTTGKALDSKFSEIKISYKKNKEEKKFNILGEAYSNILLGCIDGDHSLFVSKEEVLESWRILDTAQKDWKESKDNLIIYKKGSTIGEILSKDNGHK